MKATELSIVTTMYKSRPFLADFIRDCLQVVDEMKCASFEIIFVNDGSPDDSLEFILQENKTAGQFVIVDLSRNYGHHQAIMAGLSIARGDKIFLIDCDLEVSPKVLTEFDRALEKNQADVVYGYQIQRKGNVIERVGGEVFWKVLNAVSDVRIPENLLTERLMTRRYVQALLQLGDWNLFLGGMMSWVGFAQIGLPIQKQQRSGKSTYSTTKRIALMINAISSFSSKPLVWLFYVGLGVTIVSMMMVLYIVARKVLYNDALIGFTSIVVLMGFSLGVLSSALGLVGIYVGKIYSQVQRRPCYIIRDIYRD